MSQNSGVLSLAELDGYRSETFAWDLTLPEYVLPEQIGVNVGLIRRIARLGGLDHVRIGSYDGERTRTDAEVSSMGEDGSATAGMKSVQSKANSIRTDITDNGIEPNKDNSEYWWADATVDVNAVDLGDRVLEHARRGGSLRDERIWARLLNKDIKRGLAQAVNDHLIGHVSGWSRAVLGVTLGATFFNAYTDTLPISHFSVANLIINYLDATVIQQGVNTFMNSSRGIPFHERRLSLIPAYQLDRLAVAQGILKARKLVKAQKGGKSIEE